MVDVRLTSGYGPDMRHRIEIRSTPRERALIDHLAERLNARTRRHNPAAPVATRADVLRLGVHLAAVDLGIEAPATWTPEEP